jgi:hypothetical protein
MPRKQKARAAVNARTRELFTEKLASSGLDFEDAELLGLETIEAEEVQQIHAVWPNKPAIKINYFDAFGDPVADVPKAPPFFRLRFLGQGTSFKDMAGKELRYVQLPDTAPCAYLPRSYAWGDVLPDVGTSVIITEGELKAAKACKEGFPTIGLGGVWNFRSNKYGISFVKELEQFEWLRRNVYVVFDSDLASNQNVLAALEELCYELQQRGAFVHVVWLPEVLGSGEKVGLDDFLLFHGDKCKEEFVEVLRQAEHIGLVKPLFDLNQRFVYVANPGLIIDQHTQAKHKPGALKEHLAAPTTVSVKELTADGKIKYKRASAGAEWLKWPLRNSVSKISYLPGKPRFVNGNGPLTYYNEWCGWGVEPRKGDVTPFLQLLKHLFTGADNAGMSWLLKWLAYPLQYPGAKLFTSVVVWGRRHGTGKSLVGHTMSKIYGDNFTMIKQKDLHGSFNEWAQNKQFVLGDDVTGSDSRIDADILKTLITQEIIRVNPKYVPSYEVPDCINYFFTSNQPDAFFLEDDDRRFFIHEVTVEPMPEGWYMDYALWLDSGGAEAVFDFLMKLDLSDFNPAGRAMKTLAKERMQADVRSDLGAWVRKLLQDPDTLLKIGEIPLKKDLFTNHELLQMYDPMQRTRTTANGLGRELRRAGAVQALDGRPIRTKSGQDRYYVLRNHDKWAKASHTELAQHVDDGGKPHKGSGSKY